MLKGFFVRVDTLLIRRIKILMIRKNYESMQPLIDEALRDILEKYGYGEK